MNGCVEVNVVLRIAVRKMYSKIKQKKKKNSGPWQKETQENKTKRSTESAIKKTGTIMAKIINFSDRRKLEKYKLFAWMGEIFDN